MSKITELLKKYTAGTLAVALVLAFAFGNFHVPAKTGSSQSLSDLLVQSADAAAVDYFLQIDGIDGESMVVGHTNQIEVDSYSWGVSNTGSFSSGGGGGAGKASFQDFHFTSKVSKASPKLMLATAKGEHIPKATLFVVRKADKSGAQEFMKITLEDVLVTSYQQSGGGGAHPDDQFSLNYAKIRFEYRQQKPDGTLDAPITAEWDVKGNLEL